jgi:RNA recognition motif-containing protein
VNIYVGNISRELSEEDLREAFASYGQVSSVNIIKDKFTGEYRGFAFVEMPVKEEAEAAIGGLNGRDLKGRAINVNEARPKSDDRRGGHGRGGSRRGTTGRRRF